MPQLKTMPLCPRYISSRSKRLQCFYAGSLPCWGGPVLLYENSEGSEYAEGPGGGIF